MPSPAGDAHCDRLPHRSDLAGDCSLHAARARWDCRSEAGGSKVDLAMLFVPLARSNAPRAPSQGIAVTTAESRSREASGDRTAGESNAEFDKRTGVGMPMVKQSLRCVLRPRNKDG